MILIDTISLPLCCHYKHIIIPLFCDCCSIINKLITNKIHI
jgi:hypothetical protein